MSNLFSTIFYEVVNIIHLFITSFSYGDSMSNNLIRDALLMTAIVGGGVYAFTHRPMIYELIGVSPQDIVTAREMRENPPAPIEQINTATTMEVRGSATSISKSGDGQFWTEARVNSTSIKFLVDTGASVVALTPLDSQKAGFRPHELNYTATVNTASGSVKAAPVTLDIISVGNVTVRNVRAVVISEGLPHSLLGMSYLGQLQKMEATQNALILRQ